MLTYWPKTEVPCNFFSYHPTRHLCELNFYSTTHPDAKKYPVKANGWQSYLPVSRDQYDRKTMTFKGQPLVFINNYKLKSGQK